MSVFMSFVVVLGSTHAFAIGRLTVPLLPTGRLRWIRRVKEVEGAVEGVELHRLAVAQVGQGNGRRTGLVRLAAAVQKKGDTVCRHDTSILSRRRLRRQGPAGGYLA